MNFQLVSIAASGPQTFMCSDCGVKVTQFPVGNNPRNGVRVGDRLNGEVWADLDGPAFKYHCWYCKLLKEKVA